MLRIVRMTAALVFTSAAFAQGPGKWGDQPASPAPPPVWGKSGDRPLAPAAPPVKNAINPALLAKGSITIIAPSSGATLWADNVNTHVRATLNGTSSQFVDVTLWRDGRFVATLATRVAGIDGLAAVPEGTPPGAYELHVFNSDDSRVDAHVAVNVAVPSVTVTAPPAPLVAGSSYTAKWSFVGSPDASVRIDFVSASGTVLKAVAEIIGISRGAWTFTVPPPAQNAPGQYRLQVSAAKTSTSQGVTVWGTSGLFTLNPAPPVDVPCPTSAQIQMTATVPSGFLLMPIFPGDRLRLSLVMVRNKGEPGASATHADMTCFYDYGYPGSAGVGLMQMSKSLPEGQTCTKTAAGAHCQ